MDAPRGRGRLSLSKFVQKCVEYAIEQGGPDFAELRERSKKIQELEQEVNELREQIKQKDIVIEKLENDLGRARLEPFPKDEEFEGAPEYDREYIEILQDAGSIRSDELGQRLDIDPSQSDLMQGIDQQLQPPENYGLVASTAHGWRWVG